MMIWLKTMPSTWHWMLHESQWERKTYASSGFWINAEAEGQFGISCDYSASFLSCVKDPLKSVSVEANCVQIRFPSHKFNISMPLYHLKSERSTQSEANQIEISFVLISRNVLATYFTILKQEQFSYAASSCLRQWTKRIDTENNLKWIFFASIAYLSSLLLLHLI